MGKGGQERIVPFGAATQRPLWRYQHHYRPEPLGPGVYFFLTLDGRPLGRSALAVLRERRHLHEQPALAAPAIRWLCRVGHLEQSEDGSPVPHRVRGLQLCGKILVR